MNKNVPMSKIFVKEITVFVLLHGDVEEAGPQLQAELPDQSDTLIG